MRTLFGMILGAALTIGGAYVYDSLTTAPVDASQPSASQTQRPMVNWDVVGANWRSFKSTVHQGWTRLSSVDL